MLSFKTILLSLLFGIVSVKVATFSPFENGDDEDNEMVAKTELVTNEMLG